MPHDSVAQRFFGISQGLFVVAIGVGMYLFWRHNRDRERSTHIKLESLDAWAAIKRVRTGGGTGSGTVNRNRSPKTDSNTPKPAPPTDRPALESAFPSWDNSTPPHEILGVHPSAKPPEIEAAYKQLLKQYHPDRVAHWGKGYQSRAHYVVLLVQAARDRMLGKG